MKKIIFLVFSAFMLLPVHAQMITDDEFDAAEDKYLPDINLKDRSKWLFDQGWFSSDGLPMYNTVIKVDSSLTKDQIYVSAFQTIVSSFRDANVVTKLQDREAGSFIVEGFFWVYGRVSVYTTESNVCCQIRVDVKPGKVRVIAIPQYVEIRAWNGKTSKPVFERPYTEGYKKSVGGNRYSAKVYLRTYIWSKILMDRVEKHVTIGASGIENDDW